MYLFILLVYFRGNVYFLFYLCILISSILVHFIILFIFNFKCNTNLCTLFLVNTR